MGTVPARRPVDSYRPWGVLDSIVKRSSDFAESYRPDMRGFRGRPPKLAAVARAHDGVSGRGPGEEEPRVECPAAERVMPRAEGVPHDQRELRYGAVAHRVDQLGPAPDDAAPLGVAAHVETVHVLDEEDRHPALV